MNMNVQPPMGISPTQAEIERNVRVVIGDLHVQLVIAQARIAELESQLAALMPPQEPEPFPAPGPKKVNGGKEPPAPGA